MRRNTFSKRSWGLLYVPAPPPLSHPPRRNIRGIRWETKTGKLIFSSKIVLFYEGTRLRASPRHGGARSNLAFLVTNPPHRKPHRGGGVYRTGEERVSDPLIISGLSDFYDSGVNPMSSYPFLQSRRIISFYSHGTATASPAADRDTWHPLS